MNNIQFRVWDTKLQKWADPHRFYLIDEDGALFTDLSFSQPTVGGKFNPKDGEYIIQQWSGCYDSKGEKIYIGDRIKISWGENDRFPSFSTVEFRSGTFGVVMGGGFSELRYWVEVSGKRIEVIGNILEGDNEKA